MKTRRGSRSYDHATRYMIETVKGRMTCASDDVTTDETQSARAPLLHTDADDDVT
jgi:hypothetical protein